MKSYLSQCDLRDGVLFAYTPLQPDNALTAILTLMRIQLFSFQNLSGLCVAIWNQFIRENQLRVESHWNERWVINDRRVWSADAPFRLEDGDTNQDQYPQCLRMSFTPVEEWARVASKCRCRSRTSLFIDGMDTRGLDTCLQQVFSMGWDA